MIWISPTLIECVERRGTIHYPNKGLERSDYTSAAVWIAKLKRMQENNIDPEEYLKIEPLKEAIDIFYNDPVRVIWSHDHYELGDQGRHRVKAAQMIMCEAIPVLIVDVR